MSEYIVSVHDEEAELFIARFDIGGTTLFGHQLIGEIVRCRDCIGLVETWDGWECERFSGEYHRAEPKGFCAWGERRTDDN